MKLYIEIILLLLGLLNSMDLFGQRRCTGLTSCAACTSCNYCKYCNDGGGSCGVCGGGHNSVYQGNHLGNKSAPATRPVSSYIKVSRANVRIFPSSEAIIMGTVNSYTLITIIYQYGEWYKVKIGSYTGYMHKSLF